MQRYAKVPVDIKWNRWRNGGKFVATLDCKCDHPDESPVGEGNTDDEAFNDLLTKLKCYEADI